MKINRIIIVCLASVCAASTQLDAMYRRIQQIQQQHAQQQNTVSQFVQVPYLNGPVQQRQPSVPLVIAQVFEYINAQR